MKKFLAFFYTLLAVLSVLALGVIAYKLTYGALEVGPTRDVNGVGQIDYTNVVVILLTTVTVIFTVCALALAVLAVVGFRSLKRDAGKFATQQAISVISEAFDEGGQAHVQIQAGFTDEDGHLKRWLERRLRLEVIALLPLVIDRLPSGRANLGLAEDTPTDEGDVD